MAAPSAAPMPIGKARHHFICERRARRTHFDPARAAQRRDDACPFSNYDWFRRLACLLFLLTRSLLFSVIYFLHNASDRQNVNELLIRIVSLCNSFT